MPQSTPQRKPSGHTMAAELMWVDNVMQWNEPELQGQAWVSTLVLPSILQLYDLEQVS